MRKAFIVFNMGMILVLVVVACGPRPTSLRLDHGESYTQALEAQIMNPEAIVERDPPVGLDGQATQEMVKRYRSYFQKPPTAQKEGGGKSIINIGTGGE